MNAQISEKNDQHIPLPGESGPLEMRYGGAPVTDEEALGVARRMARLQKAQGRKLSSLGAVDEMPAHDAPKVQSAHRFSPALLFRVRAKAEMEGVTLTEVVETALEAYAASSPGAKVQYVPRRNRH